MLSLAFIAIHSGSLKRIDFSNRSVWPTLSFLMFSLLLKELIFIFLFLFDFLLYIHGKQLRSCWTADYHFYLKPGGRVSHVYHFYLVGHCDFLLIRFNS